jgi:hypothetical protein
VKKSKPPGTHSLVKPVGVSLDDRMIAVELSDGRVLSVPLAWFPRLSRATQEQHEKYELSPGGLHWDELDEDISIAGLLAGRADQTARPQRAAE